MSKKNCELGNVGLVLTGSTWRMSGLCNGRGFICGLGQFAVGAALLAFCLVDGALGGMIVATVSTADGDGADTRVTWGTTADPDQSDTNYGTAITMYTRAAGLGFHGVSSKMYLRFDLTSQGNWGAIQSYANSVTLYLRDNYSSLNTTFTVDVYGLNDGHPDENWGELTITWNNAPANLNANPGFSPTEATYLGQFTYTQGETYANNWVSFSSTALADFLRDDTDGVVTLMLSNPANTSAQFATKERADSQGGAPYLVIIPEPTAAFLLLGGIAATLARRRR